MKCKANFLAKRKIEQSKGSETGKAFEHFILLELIAIEVKINEQIDKADSKGLIAFSAEYKIKMIKWFVMKKECKK